MGTGLVLAPIVPFVAQGADQFASSAFEWQWRTVEGAIPNFWGPLETARNGQAAQYIEGSFNGQQGVRLVQDPRRLVNDDGLHPISPAFATNARVNKVDNTLVFVQAFERRVLTYTAANPAAFRVEFGTIGCHYYRWRYEIPNPAPSPRDPDVTVTATMVPTATAPATATPTLIATPIGTAPAPIPVPRVPGSP